MLLKKEVKLFLVITFLTFSIFICTMFISTLVWVVNVNDMLSWEAPRPLSVEVCDEPAPTSDPNIIFVEREITPEYIENRLKEREAKVVERQAVIFEKPMPVGISYEPIVEVSEYEVDLLARAISSEAWTQGEVGMLAVAEVLYNRVDHPLFPDTLEEVVYQQLNGKYQFCVVPLGAIDRTPKDEAVKVAQEFLRRNKARTVFKHTDVFWFNNASIDSWAKKNRTYYMTIGDHAFFRLGE